VIYLDTSAMVKLVTAEPESGELIRWLNGHSDEVLATSTIGHIELIRAARRLGAAATAAAQRVASMTDTLVLTDTIATAATTIGAAELRTLDAIHLATADLHRSRLSAFCVYEHRLLAAARVAQLPTVAPGIT
jgi:predicted nucleic acid-binding protein